MSLESFVAFRYLAASRKLAHIALITTISILGLAVGVAALVLSLALLSGFQDRIRFQIVERSPHLRVSPSRGASLPEPLRVAQELARLPGVVSVEPSIEGRGWASRVRGETTVPIRYRNARLDAVEADAYPRARATAQLASRVGAGTGDLLWVTSSRTRLSPIGPIPVAVVLRVADIQRSGALEKAPDLEVSEKIARLLSGRASGARAYEVKLAEAGRAAEAARRASGSLGPAYLVETWHELNAPLSFALRLEKVVIFVTVALVIVVAALNIVSNLALLVVEKKRDLGVLTSLGAEPRSLAKVYLTLGGTIGAVGTSLGVAVGVASALLLDRFGVIPLPADVYLLTHVPFAVHWGEVLLVSLFAFGTAVAAALFPARAAAKLAPGEAMRLSR